MPQPNECCHVSPTQLHAIVHTVRATANFLLSVQLSATQCTHNEHQKALHHILHAKVHTLSSTVSFSYFSLRSASACRCSASRM
jgi:hypothetical protein